MPKSSLTRRLIAGVVFGFLVVVALMLFSDLQKVSSRIYGFRWELFPIVLLLTLFNYTLRGIKFHYYVQLISSAKVPLKNTSRLFLAGFPLAVTPGKVGEALKGIWIHHETGAPTAKGISVVLAERISDGLAVLFLSTLGVIAYPHYWPAFTIVLILLLGFILISQIQPIALGFLNLIARIPLVNRIVPGLETFYEGSYILFKPTATLIAVSLGMISWLGEGIGFYLILTGLGIPPSTESLSIAVFILAFSTVVGAVTALPGGLGAAEASISGMLVFLLDLTQDTAAAATLLIRFATLWFGIGIGLVTWGFSRDLLGLRTRTNELQKTIHETS
jgi:uncharacterized protein (TIRG00374 family)